jgi:hypothetical protein
MVNLAPMYFGQEIWRRLIIQKLRPTRWFGEAAGNGQFPSVENFVSVLPIGRVLNRALRRKVAASCGLARRTPCRPGTIARPIANRTFERQLGLSLC